MPRFFYLFFIGFVFSFSGLFSQSDAFLKRLEQIPFPQILKPFILDATRNVPLDNLFGIRQEVESAGFCIETVEKEKLFCIWTKNCGKKDLFPFAKINNDETFVLLEYSSFPLWDKISSFLLDYLSAREKISFVYSDKTERAIIKLLNKGGATPFLFQGDRETKYNLLTKSRFFSFYDEETVLITFAVGFYHRIGFEFIAPSDLQNLSSSHQGSSYFFFGRIIDEQTVELEKIYFEDPFYDGFFEKVKKVFTDQGFNVLQR